MTQWSLGLTFFKWFNAIILHSIYNKNLVNTAFAFFYMRLCIRIYLTKWVFCRKSVEIRALVDSAPTLVFLFLLSGCREGFGRGILAGHGSLAQPAQGLQSLTCPFHLGAPGATSKAARGEHSILMHLFSKWIVEQLSSRVWSIVLGPGDIEVNQKDKMPVQVEATF